MEATEVLHKKKLLAPKLRFKGFSDEWKPKHIGSILTIGSGRDYKHLSSGDIPVFGTGGLMTMVDKFLYDGATVCIGRKGTIDKPMYFEGKLWTVDTLFYTHLFVGSTPKFVYNLFQKINWKEYNEASGVPSLSKATIEKIKVSIPTLSEQQKIASFLSALDEKIQQLTRKKELLEQYKKGAMQQLLSGKLRFKDENRKAFPKWENKKLGDVCEIKGRIGYRGYTVQDIVKEGEGAITLSPSNITEGQLSFNDSTYISWFKYDESPEIKIEVNDILLVKTGSTVGKSAFVKSLNQPATINPQLVVLKKISAAIDPHYLAYLVFHSTVQKQIVAAVGGGAVPNMSQESISGFLLPCPIRLEQQKISDYLSNIDNKIEIVNKQITQTQTFKKGLLQQMFV